MRCGRSVRPVGFPVMRDTMRNGLTAALKERDRTAIGALRAALAAIENAETVAPDSVDSGSVDREHVAGAALGNGAADVPRRQLSESEVAAIVTAEVRERSTNASEYERLGQYERAQRLRAEADVLNGYLAEIP